MIDAQKTTYELTVTDAGGKEVRVTPIITDFSIDDNEGELAVRLSITVKQHTYNGHGMGSLFKGGALVRAYADWGGGNTETFRGPVWTSNQTEALQTDNIVITAYDNLIYVQKSDDYRYIPKGTSSKKAIMGIFKDWSIPVAVYNGPDFSLDKKAYNQALSEQILDILSDAKKKGLGKYNIRSERGKVSVQKRGSNSPVYHFSGYNTSETSAEMTMDELVTRVKIIGPEEQDDSDEEGGGDTGPAPVEKKIDGDTSYGVLQKVMQRPNDKELSEVVKEANQLIKDQGKPKWTRRFQSEVDLPFLKKGDKVHITAGILDGYYYITSIQHNAKNGMMAMEVEP